MLKITLPDYSFNRQNSQERTNDEFVDVHYLKMINPSTGEIHLEGVPTKEDNRWDYMPETTVLAALAWRDGETELVWEKDKNGNSEQVCKWKYTKPVILT